MCRVKRVGETRSKGCRTSCGRAGGGRPSLPQIHRGHRVDIGLLGFRVLQCRACATPGGYETPADTSEQT